ncbi:hypothetical protein GCM10022410_22930 [Amphibacillus indicireducens]|uniref:Uncharacterized protein n=1 Tax=Amphibacillus indicireducens TaxID=1076330 RepID=A0ABP7VZ79_9BACI
MCLAPDFIEPQVVSILDHIEFYSHKDLLFIVYRSITNGRQSIGAADVTGGNKPISVIKTTEKAKILNIFLM